MAKSPHTLLKRNDLTPPYSLTQEFAKIRNILAGQASGMTLDQSLANQLIDILLCKMYDENNTKKNEVVRLQLHPGENSQKLLDRINQIYFEVKQIPEIGTLFINGDSISIQPNLLAEIINIIQPYELTRAKRDVIGEAFESFIGSSLRGEEGQFFTPRNIVEMICEIINPKSGEIILDPACGTGGFLTQAIKHHHSKMNSNWSVYGIDKDAFLARVAAIQVGLLRDKADGWCFCANSLDYPSNWPTELFKKMPLGSVDVIMTNPPFGSKISVGSTITKSYDLGKTWKKKTENKWEKTNSFETDRPPQLLFIERCLQFLKPGGRMAIVLPDGVLGNQKEGYVRQYIKEIADIIAIVDLPLETFMPSTSTKTSVLFLRKKQQSEASKEIFMAIGTTCGHDRRGNAIFNLDGSIKDDLLIISNAFRNWSVNNAKDF